MNKNIRIISAILALLLAITACNLPSNNPNQPGSESTAIAQTVAAQLTQSAPIVTNTPVTPLPIITTVAPPTIAPPPTTAIPPSATSTCDISQFITDVTIPDGTIVTPGQAFTKTWRFKNVGACSWTPSYAVVFSSGNSMSGPATQALSANVNPGQTIDISVNLVAPATPGDYTGYWKLRNAAGVLFAQFYVQIKVQANATPTATPTSTLPPAIAQVTLTNLTSEDGFISSDGTINGNPNVGDDASNNTMEAFVSFDMSSIPSTATITKVVVDFGSGSDTLGSPWALSDGCLRAYAQNYGTLDFTDFFIGDPLGAVIKWCGPSVLSSTFEEPGMKSIVQSRVGASRLQLRLQFRVPTTNGNGVADVIRLGTVKLIVTYQ